MTRQSNILHCVAAAAGAREYAERSYRETIIEAAKHYSQADIARAAGVTRQAVQSLLVRAADEKPEPTLEELQARAEFLEKRQASVVDAIARKYLGLNDRADQLARNRNNGTIAKGPGAKGYRAASRRGKLATVAEDRELAAALELDQFCEDHPSEPVVLTFLAERRELLALRHRIEALEWPEWARV